MPQAIGRSNDGFSGLAAGLAFALSGAAGMAVADAFMARRAVPENVGAWTMMISPTSGGVIGVLSHGW